MSKNCNVGLPAPGSGRPQSQPQRLSAPHGRQRRRFRGLLQHPGGQSFRRSGENRPLRLALLFLLGLGSSLWTLPAWAGDASICGVWATSQNEAYIRIYQVDGLYDGISLPDAEASVAAARAHHQPVILSGFAASPEHPGLYRYGRIFDPRNGQHFQGRLHLESEDRLKVYGYLGFSWLGGSTQWRRVARRPCSPADTTPAPADGG